MHTMDTPCDQVRTQKKSVGPTGVLMRLNRFFHLGKNRIHLRVHLIDFLPFIDSLRFIAVLGYETRYGSHTKNLSVGSHTKVFDSWCGSRQISENRQQSRCGTYRRTAAIAHSLNSGPGGWRSEPISGGTRPVWKYRDRNLGKPHVTVLSVA